MTAGGQHETLLATEQLGAAIGRFPRRDMVFSRREEVAGRGDLAEVDRHAFQFDGPGHRQQILLIHLAQIETMHLRGHAGGIAVPVQQVEREGLVAKQIVVDHERPDQVVGAQHVEGGRHFAAFEVAALVHFFFQRGKLLLVDEYAELAGFLEVHHGHEEGRGFDPVVALGGHESQCAGQQGAAQAVADGIDLALPGGALDGVQRVQVAHPHVVLKFQL